MRKSFGSLVLGLLVSSALTVSQQGLARASEWEIDASHSKVGFGVRHLMVSTTRGSFGKFSGKINLDDKDVTKSTLTVEIETASINTENADRDKHLRADDFFSSEKFPKMTFKSTKIAKKGADLLVTGDLSIRGVTKPVTLTVSDLTPEVKDPWGNIKRGAHGVAKISRKEFGLNWNKTLETGGVVVGDEIKIELDVELGKVVPKPAK